MKLTPEELSAQQFVLMDQLDHDDIVPFIQQNLKKWTSYAVIYFIANMLSFGLAGFLLVRGWKHPEYSIASDIGSFITGLTLAFLLLPLHEYIHVLAYRSQGAKQTSYAANLRKFYFMALADRFVANKKEFTIVALAPFVSITAMLLILFFALNPSWQPTVVGTLLLHTAMCSGDFGLLCYLDIHRDKEIVTYDDVPAKLTYFYGRPGKMNQD